MENLTLEQLTGVAWDPPVYLSDDVLRYHEARKIPIFDLTASQLLLLFSQKISPDELIFPIVSTIENDPRIFEDRLLTELLEFLPGSSHDSNPELSSRISRIVDLPVFAELSPFDYLAILIENFKEHANC